MIFELQWGDYDAEQHWLFSHDKTRDEFSADCNRLIVEYGEEYINNSVGERVGVCDWLEYIADKLQALGYELIRPIGCYYQGASTIRDDDRRDAWSALVGEELIDKAVKHNFMVSLRKSKDIFIIDGVYHTRDCQILLDAWREQVFALRWADLGSSYVSDTAPCEVCKPEKPWQ